jgi:MbtH protein
MNSITDTEQTFVVVVNDEEQYSIWPERRELPAGWRAINKTGSKQDCLNYIKEVWTDMRPASLRRKMAENSESSS